MAAVSAEHDELLERYETMRSELERLRVRANSPDLSVTVESGPGGGVISVRLSSDALRQSPESLSATITATIRAASGKAAEATRKVVAPMTADPAGAASLAAGRLPGTGSATAEPRRTHPTDPEDEVVADESSLRGQHPSPAYRVNVEAAGGVDDLDDAEEGVFDRG